GYLGLDHLDDAVIGEDGVSMQRSGFGRRRQGRRWSGRRGYGRRRRGLRVVAAAHPPPSAGRGCGYYEGGDDAGDHRFRRAALGRRNLELRLVEYAGLGLPLEEGELALHLLHGLPALVRALAQTAADDLLEPHRDFGRYLVHGLDFVA